MVSQWEQNRKLWTSLRISIPIKVGITRIIEKRKAFDFYMYLVEGLCCVAAFSFLKLFLFVAMYSTSAFDSKSIYTPLGQNPDCYMDWNFKIQMSRSRYCLLPFLAPFSKSWKNSIWNFFLTKSFLQFLVLDNTKNKYQLKTENPKFFAQIVKIIFF